MTALVVVNFSSIRTDKSTKSVCELVYFCCFCDSLYDYEYDRLFQYDHGLSETVTVVLAP